MLGLGWGEILLVGILALVVLGPKRLPDAARSLGKAWGSLRRSFQEATRDIRTELNDVNRQIADVERETRAQVRSAADRPAEEKETEGEVTADADLAEFVGEVTGRTEDDERE